MQALLERSILGLQELDDHQLMAVDPAGDNRQEKGQQRRRGTHYESLPQPLAEYLDTTGLRTTTEDVRIARWALVCRTRRRSR